MSFFTGTRPSASSRAVASTNRVFSGSRAPSPPRPLVAPEIPLTPLVVVRCSSMPSRPRSASSFSVLRMSKSGSLESANGADVVGTVIISMSGSAPSNLSAEGSGVVDWGRGEDMVEEALGCGIGRVARVLEGWYRGGRGVSEQNRSS